MEHYTVFSLIVDVASVSTYVYTITDGYFYLVRERCVLLTLSSIIKPLYVIKGLRTKDQIAFLFGQLVLRILFLMHSFFAISKFDRINYKDWNFHCTCVNYSEHFYSKTNREIYLGKKIRGINCGYRKRRI